LGHFAVIGGWLWPFHRL